jgi:hypothetical protein
MQYITMLVFMIRVHFYNTYTWKFLCNILQCLYSWYACTSANYVYLKACMQWNASLMKLHKTQRWSLAHEIFSISPSFLSHAKIWAKICSDQEISSILLNRSEQNFKYTFLTFQQWCLAYDNFWVLPPFSSYFHSIFICEVYLNSGQN